LLGTRIIKLVRDVIPTRVKSGEWYYITVPESKRGKFLRKKLIEEVSEYLEDRTLEELADIFEVCVALAVHEHSVGASDLLAIADSKRDEKGGFADLLAIEIREGNGQAQYGS